MSMSSVGDSPASQLAAQEKGKAKKTRAGYGRSSAESFAAFGQNGCLSKMYRGCYLLTLEGSLLEYCETFPKAGMMRNGILYRLPALEHHTSEKECSLWPTPVSQDDNKSPEAHMAMKQRMKGGPRKKRTSLNVMVKAVERGMWPTPSASDGMGGPGCSGRDGGKNLRTVVQSFPTPAAMDYRGPNRNGNMADQLPNVIGGSLNADWVELLMGFSRGWTDLGAKDGKMEPPESQRAKKTE